MSKIIAVIGATGTQGGSVARTFLNKGGWEVRGITRNPESPGARQLESDGIMVVKADLNDVKSLTSAFEGVNAVFGVTDFWQFVDKPSTQDMVKSKDITWNEACYLEEVQHGKNIFDAAAQVVEQGLLERVIFSSLSNAKKASQGQYGWVYHFDSKAKVVQYLEEKAQESSQYLALFERTSYVHMGYYLDNWKRNPIFTPKKDADGTFVIRYITSNSATRGNTHPTPFVHPPNDTGPFVEALIEAPPRTTMLGTCSSMLFSEYVKLWGEIHGVNTVLKSLSIDDVVSMWPNGFGREVAETACYTMEFGWDGGEGAILPEQAGVNRSSLTDVSNHINATDWSSVFHPSS